MAKDYSKNVASTKKAIKKYGRLVTHIAVTDGVEAAGNDIYALQLSHEIKLVNEGLLKSEDLFMMFSDEINELDYVIDDGTDYIINKVFPLKPGSSEIFYKAILSSGGS